MTPVTLTPEGFIPPEQCDGEHYLSPEEFPELFEALGLTRCPTCGKGPGNCPDCT